MELVRLYTTLLLALARLDAVSVGEGRAALGLDSWGRLSLRGRARAPALHELGLRLFVFVEGIQEAVDILL